MVRVPVAVDGPVAVHAREILGFSLELSVHTIMGRLRVPVSGRSWIRTRDLYIISVTL